MLSTVEARGWSCHSGGGSILGSDSLDIEEEAGGSEVEGYALLYREFKASWTM